MSDDSKQKILDWLAEQEAAMTDLLGRLVNIDSGFTAQIGVPTLCALGPIGGEAHTPNEYMQVETMVTRARVLAATLMSF